MTGSGVIDPLAELEIDIQSFDIPRLVTVYPDRGGIRWWTKAWFNNKEEGEASVEISRQVAVRFIQDEIEKDAMLEEYFPKQMEVYHQAIEQTREQLLNQMNMKDGHHKGTTAVYGTGVLHGNLLQRPSLTCHAKGQG